MKQINLFTPFWRESIKYLGWVILFAVLWFRGCSDNEKSSTTVKVTLQEVKGKFEPKKPKHEAVSSKIEHTEKVETIYKDNPINKKLIAENEKLKLDFAKANDSIKKLLFNKAIQLNKFSTDFEDENLVLNINGIVQGEVKEITPNYKIKEKTLTVPVKQKETVFRVLAGGGLGINKDLNQSAYQLDINFQNRKGNIISAEYLKIGSQEFGMVGFKKSIINFKR